MITGGSVGRTLPRRNEGVMRAEIFRTSVVIGVMATARLRHGVLRCLAEDLLHHLRPIAPERRTQRVGKLQGELPST
jgi:hypothetical protein